MVGSGRFPEAEKKAADTLRAKQRAAIAFADYIFAHNDLLRSLDYSGDPQIVHDAFLRIAEYSLASLDAKIAMDALEELRNDR